VARQGVEGFFATEIPYSFASSLTSSLVMQASAKGLMIPNSLIARMPGR